METILMLAFVGFAIWAIIRSRKSPEDGAAAVRDRLPTHGADMPLSQIAMTEALVDTHFSGGGGGGAGGGGGHHHGGGADGGVD